jgi:hypothetical protein
MEAMMRSFNQTSTALAILAVAAVAFTDEKPGPTPVKEPELRNELLRRTGPDQDVRKALMRWTSEHGYDLTALSPERKAEFDKLAAEAEAVDTENTAWLKTVVEKHGWPTITLVGRDGAGAAWLLVQHADRDRKFQRQCLDLMAALPKDEVSQSNFAYLTDRVLLAEGKKQLYGSQYKLVDGKLKPRPIEDEANVDKRRSEVGLMPLAEYFQFAEQHVLGSRDKK